LSSAGSALDPTDEHWFWRMLQWCWFEAECKKGTF
jgi:hypothetical protein